nr:MAG TPA: hypothetical protein [Caudoviricetes sp.]
MSIFNKVFYNIIINNTYFCYTSYCNISKIILLQIFFL